jgi:hypothetical protein
MSLGFSAHSSAGDNGRADRDDSDELICPLPQALDEAADPLGATGVRMRKTNNKNATPDRNRTVLHGSELSSEIANVLLGVIESGPSKLCR